ncbi:uncharacterized protein LOC127866932 [Dreissena polymorpha]|uniref:Uncharacterized protein n=1 Tax=Dreissena polymorpha TaxID=45954 RepID=A0A9D4N4F1_DREPO|nr:uncharacterized protein LOC127866932 [Dreissena polymorpha]KAH3888905.1 hypothetical protein DPMN_012949 [Dreissena polymorpha]
MLQKKQPSTATYGNGVLSTVALVLMVLVLLLLCGGFASPGWVFLRGPANINSHRGLWYVVGCSDKCETVGVNNWSQADKDNWLDNQIESSVAVGLAVLVFVLLIWQRGSSTLNTRFALGCVAIPLCFASAVLALIPVGQKGNLNRKYADSSHDVVKFPYSLFIFGLGAVFIFVVALILLWDIIRFRSYQARKDKKALLASMNGNSPSRKQKTQVLTEPHQVKSSQPVYYGNTNDAVYVASKSPTVFTVPGVHYTYTNAQVKPLRTSQMVTRSVNEKSQTLGHQSPATTTYVTRTTTLKREQHQQQREAPSAFEYLIVNQQQQPATTTYVTRATTLERENQQQQQQRETSPTFEYRVVNQQQQPVITTSTTSFRDSRDVQQLRMSSPSVKRHTTITTRPMSATVRAVPTYYKQYIEAERVVRPQSQRSRPRSQKRTGSYYTSKHYVSLGAL